MKKSNKHKLRFDTEKNTRSLRFKRFAVAFSCFFILLASVSFLLLLKHYDFDLSAIASHGEEDQTAEETTAAPAPEVEGVRNYLLLCTADGSNSIRFISVVTADLNQKLLSIRPLDPAASVSVTGCSGNFSQQLDYGGTAQLVLAVEKSSGMRIDKYIRSTDSKFKSIINYVGGIEVNVEKQIDIRTPELTAVIAKGPQTMTGDTMLKYMRCFENSPEKQAKIIADMIEQKITLSNLNKADIYYKKIINLSESDISIVDFADMKRSFRALLYDTNSVSVSVNAEG